MNKRVLGGSVVKNLPDHEKETQEMQFRSLSGDDSLEKEMMTHSIILPRMISEKPDGLQSIGLDMTEHTQIA